MKHLLLLLAFSLQLLQAETPPQAGPLVIVGGGGTTRAITDEALRLAGGKKARVAVVPFASKKKDEGRGLAEFWRERGAKTVEILDARKPKSARKALEKADLIWLGGGSQSLLMERLREAKLVEDIRKAHARGAVVGGTSAGAAVQSKAMITGKAELDRIEAEGTVTAEGLGLWTGVIVDQHFHRRRRFNRLVSAVLDRPRLVGVGIDERTAVIVEGKGLRVVGRSSVLIVDARQAKVAETKSESPRAATDVTLHLLRDGDRWSLRTQSK